MIFELIKKVTLLALPGICVKQTILWFINILRKRYTSEKSISQVIAKKFSWLMRF